MNDVSSNKIAFPKDRVYLTGFMGSGKSTVGPILANTIGYDFIDLDKAIERTEGMSITDIFRVRGEAYFRQREQEHLHRMGVRPRLVVSLGGGTLVDPESYRMVRSTGIIVYLKLSPEEIFRRLGRRSDRPLLTDAAGGKLSPEALRVRIDQLYDERKVLYETADVTVVSDETRLGITVDRIVKLLSPLLG